MKIEKLDGKSITKIENIAIFSTAMRFLKLLKTEGICAFVTGGALRNLMLNLEIKDMDIAVATTPEIMLKTLEKLGVKSEIFAIRFGNITAHFEGFRLEITSFRLESAYNNRYPQEIKFLKAKNTDEAKKLMILDSKRRDFTINAMYLDVDFNLYNKFNSTKIQCIGDANLRFKEDNLRILRAVRFAITCDLIITGATTKAIISNLKLIKNLQTNLIKQEFKKIIPSLGGTRKTTNLKLFLQILSEFFELDLNNLKILKDILKQGTKENFLNILIRIIKENGGEVGILRLLDLNKKELKILDNYKDF